MRHQGIRGFLKQAAAIGVVWAVLVFFTERPLGAQGERKHPLLKLVPTIQRRAATTATTTQTIPPQIEALLAKHGIVLHGPKEGWTYPKTWKGAAGTARFKTAIGEVFEGDQGPCCYEPQSPLYAPPWEAAATIAGPFGLAGPTHRVSTVDIDGDGDLDVFIGTKYGYVRFFRNDGSATAPEFNEVPGAGNPFDGEDVGDYAAPDFVDVDGDGDFDAFVGDYDGYIAFFRNDGTALAPAFTEISGVGNPFDAENFGSMSVPTFGDFSGDGLFDAFIGDYYGDVHYYLNTGTATVPVFTEQTGLANPFDSFSFITHTTPHLVDFDDDDDLDLFVGDSIPFGGMDFGVGVVRYFVNSGGGVLVEQVAPNSVHTTFTLTPQPAHADLDGDGDIDAIIGGKFDVPSYVRNLGVLGNPAFLDRGHSIDLVDIDDDGDLDAFAGGLFGLLKFENDGTATAPVWRHDQAGNPFGPPAAIAGPLFTFDDLDDDGDLDAFVGSKKSGDPLRYFLNIGTASSPAFAEQLGAANPMDGVAVGSYPEMDLADLDGDLDLDLVVWDQDLGVMRYFQNTGTVTTPAFTEVVGPGNPFDGFNFVELASPHLTDYDGDGDLDAFVGTFKAPTPATNFYLENTGTPAAPVFVQRDGLDNPSGGIIDFPTTPFLADADGDGRNEFYAGGPFDLRIFDPTADVLVTPTTVTTNETGTTDTFDVVLASQPEGPQTVTLNLVSSDPGEATVSSPTLLFTAANWNIPQQVTVTGQDDPIVDGSQPFTITVTVDDAATTSPCYDAVAARTVSGTNADGGGEIGPTPTGGGGPSIVEIPTVSGWGAGALASLLSLLGLHRLRRRARS